MKTWHLDRWARRSPDGLLIAGGSPGRLIRLSPAGREVLDEALDGSETNDPRPDGGPASLLRRLEDAGLIHPAPGPPGTVAAPPPRPGAVRTGDVAGPVARAGAAGGSRAAPVTFVIPVLNGERWLGGLVGSLRPRGRVIVVDDGSRDRSAAVAAAAGAEVIAVQGGPLGPAAARNLGLAAADTELVAFLDCDCEVVDPGWLDQLTWLFERDPRLALAAPRVRSGADRHTAPEGEAGMTGRPQATGHAVRVSRQGTAISAYERRNSPLDMGPDPGLTGPGRRLNYLPSAALVARRQALTEVGGFDPALRFGEDVDLCRRLHDSGWRVRYEPGSEVHHQPRSTLRAFARQRFEYGASAVELDRRHPGIAAPVRAGGATPTIWLAALGAAILAPEPARAAPSHRDGRGGRAARTTHLGGVWPWARARRFAKAPAMAAGAGGAVAAMLAGGAASAVGAITLWRLTRRFEDRESRRLVAAMALRGQAEATRHLARAATREWLPVTLPLSLRHRRARFLFALAIAARMMTERNPIAQAPLSALDNASYSAGLWVAALRTHRFTALLPRRATQSHTKIET